MSESHYDLLFLGGGQLARMSIQAAQRMGLRCVSWDADRNAPAGQIAPAVEEFFSHVSSKATSVLQRCSHVTLESEFISGDKIRAEFAHSGVSEEILVPSLLTLETIQDKLKQREALQLAGVPSPHAVEIAGDGQDAIQTIGFPMVLKARFGGYDGKGTRYARTPEEFEGHRALWSQGGWMAEGFVPFVREIAAMVWVEPDTGRSGAFPTMETVQENHVCSLVFPCETDASELAIRAVKAVHGFGLFGVEMFELADGSVQINEIAPRPHNTGHYTLDWGGPSQFDVHVRLACKLPIGELMTGLNTSGVCMANLLGQPNAGDYRPAMAETLGRFERARFHWYGKLESRPGRKMGHINLVQQKDESLSDLIDLSKTVREAFYQLWTRG